jgi:hypothetical protein
MNARVLLIGPFTWHCCFALTPVMVAITSVIVYWLYRAGELLDLPRDRLEISGGVNTDIRCRLANLSSNQASAGAAQP